MSLDFCCSCDSYSYPYRSAMRTAKKQHKCYECSLPILPGERYQYATGKCDGSWFESHACPRCLDLIEFVTAHVPCFCYEHGNAIECALACADMAGIEAPGLYFGALRRYAKIKSTPLSVPAAKER